MQGNTAADTELAVANDIMNDDWRTRGGSIWNHGQERSQTRVKCRATTCQLVQLVKFMEKHKELAVSHTQPFPGSEQLWEELARTINQFGPPKTPKQCKTTWRDLRKRAFAMMRAKSKDKDNSTGRNLYDMAPKIINLIAAAGGLPKGISGNHNKATNARIKSRVDSCFVPMCPSTSTKFPNKLFLTGPSDPKLRKKWFQAAKRDEDYSPKTIIRCCEDHFDLENDVENWMKFKFFGGKLYLKKDVVPHIFECHNRMKPLQTISATMKRHEILENIENTPAGPPPETEQSSQASSTTHQAASPAAPPTDPLADNRDVIKVARTSSGNQLVIRVSDKLHSKTNVFNRFSVSDGHFENNIIVKEEREDQQPDNEESSENMETEDPRQEEYIQEDMFPAAEAVLGNPEVANETCKALKELNETLRLFMAEYSERTQIERERLELDRARLQFDMEVFKSNSGNNTKDKS